MLEGESRKVFQFNIYINGEPESGKTEYREIIDIPDIYQFNFFLEQKINSLREREELSFSSRVSVNNEIFHIPMIDFSDANDEQLFMEFQNFKKLLISIFIYFLREDHFTLMLMLCYPKRNGENFWESYYYLIIGKKTTLLIAGGLGTQLSKNSRPYDFRVTHLYILHILNIYKNSKTISLDIKV